MSLHALQSHTYTKNELLTYIKYSAAVTLCAFLVIAILALQSQNYINKFDHCHFFEDIKNLGDKVFDLLSVNISCSVVTSFGMMTTALLLKNFYKKYPRQEENKKVIHNKIKTTVKVAVSVIVVAIAIATLIILIRSYHKMCEAADFYHHLSEMTGGSRFIPIALTFSHATKIYLGLMAFETLLITSVFAGIGFLNQTNKQRGIEINQST